MAAVTKNLGFEITTSTSYEQAYVVAKRFDLGDTALMEDAENGFYSHFSQIQTIHRYGKFHVGGPFILDPSQQRKPLCFKQEHLQFSDDIKFGAANAKSIFDAGLSPHVVARGARAIRKAAVKMFAMITPIIGKDEEDVKPKYDDALRYVPIDGGLAQLSASTGINV
ncbi:putative Luciferase-like domain-containing protein [Seiridium unicorne]|uniref:Luciferase-like domain-containing protein n=1 Tax=Seiridium unicorne TaxID=138068 RepID=A0ABR2URY4_9PEZI